MKTILLLGKTGQIGFELARTLTALGKVYAPNRKELDLSNPEAISIYLLNLKPDLIVNAAAWTGVDAAESDRSGAYALNAALPKQLAHYARDNFCRLVHYSSDYVYAGSGNEAWLESSEPNPINYYGYVKLEGDQAIIKSGANYLIFRTSWVYSARGTNFMKTMLRLAREKQHITVVDDQIGSPTPARLIAQISTLALHSNLETGVYNLTPHGETSWCGFANEIFKQAVGLGCHLKLAKLSAAPISTKDYPTPAMRPLNSRLNISKLEKKLGLEMPTWKSQLSITLEEYLEEK